MVTPMSQLAPKNRKRLESPPSTKRVSRETLKTLVTALKSPMATFSEIILDTATGKPTVDTISRRL